MHIDKVQGLWSFDYCGAAALQRAYKELEEGQPPSLVA